MRADLEETLTKLKDQVDAHLKKHSEDSSPCKELGESCPGLSKEKADEYIAAITAQFTQVSEEGA